MTRAAVFVLPLIALVAACRGSSSSPVTSASASRDGGAALPLVLVADVDLPGQPVRFDYQDLDVAKGHLVIAHMNDASVVVVNTSDGSVVKVLPGIPTARGVAVAADVGRIFVTAASRDSSTWKSASRKDRSTSRGRSSAKRRR